MEWPSSPEMVAAKVGDLGARICVRGDAQAPLFYTLEGGEGGVARINTGTES
jgi:hypothetical protein